MIESEDNPRKNNPPRKRKLIFIAILIAIVFGLYGKTINYELIWDSKIFLENEVSLIKNKPIYTAFQIGFFHRQIFIQANYYRPITLASFMVEEKLWGINNGRMRLVNILIYLISLIILYLFLGCQTKVNYFPEIATILFAVFPLNHDNIVWVVGRGDLFLFLWGILTLYFLQMFIEKNKYRFVILSSFFYLLGICSKEAFLFLLPFLFVYEFLKRRKLHIPYHLTNILITLLFFVLKTKIVGIKNIELSFLPNVIENIKILISTLGFYFKTLIFPFHYTRFISVENVSNPAFIIFGIIFSLLILYFLYQARTDKNSIIPLSLILFFMGGHTLFAYSSAFMFKIYSRFLMIPALGLLWIIGKYLIKLKEISRNLIFSVLCLSFIVSTAINSSHYANSLRFWERAYELHTNDTFILYEMANAHFDSEDYLSAELYLNKSLSFGVKKEHAIIISFLYAAIEYNKADYEKAIRWIESIEQFEDASHQLKPAWKAQVIYKKGLVHKALGEPLKAENSFKSSIALLEGEADQTNCYLQLYNLYIGQNMWEQAENLEIIIKEKFPSLINVISSQIKSEFNTMTPDEKIRYFIHYKNYNKALEILMNKSELDLNQKLLVIKLFYQAGKKQEAEKAIDEIYSQYSQDIRVLNSLSNLFLKDLFRAKQALFYYEKSLEVDKDQPTVAYIVHYLKNEYLSELKEVWPEDSR